GSKLRARRLSSAGTRDRADADPVDQSAFSQKEFDGCRSDALCGSRHQDRYVLVASAHGWYLTTLPWQVVVGSTTALLAIDHYSADCLMAIGKSVGIGYLGQRDTTVHNP